MRVLASNLAKNHGKAGVVLIRISVKVYPHCGGGKVKSACGRYLFV